jgi:hypothetical protein
MQPHGLQIADQLLSQAFLEYPNATLAFLQRKTSSVPKSAPYAPLYRTVCANALRWKRILGKLPRLKELKPSAEQWSAVAAQRHRVNRQIWKLAEQRSVFAAISTKLHICQGHRFASHLGHGAPQVSTMQHSSHSIELPSSEVSDPVGGFLRRMAILSLAR